MIEYVKLHKLYSRVVNETFYPEVPAGWEPLLEDFLESINEAAKEFQHGSIKVVQIKPRLGYMRVYIDYKLPEEQIVDLEKIASRYEKLSLKVCSSCGSIDNPIHKNVGFPKNAVCEKCYGDNNGD